VEDYDYEIYKDVYEQLTEMIDPHVKGSRYGLSSCGPNSLCSSVVESTAYLLEFWLLNRDLPEVEHP